MKFYDCQKAPSPRRVRMFIAEKGIDLPSIEVNLREREQLSEGFLQLNPRGTVPVLELDDGQCLLSTAGCRSYLESVHPTPALLGASAIEKALVADLVWRIEADGIAPVGDCLRNSSPGMKARAVTGPEDFAQIPELAERGRRRAASFFAVLDQLIADKPFLAGDAISAADIDAFVFVEFAKWVKLEMPSTAANLRRWHHAMSERPSARL